MTTLTRLQDTEEYSYVDFTVVVKLTPDETDEPPSAMRVVGASRHFYYGPAAGDAGCFRAALHHASVPPTSQREHLKLAFFFKISVRGERLVRRGLGAGGEDESAGATQVANGAAGGGGGGGVALACGAPERPRSGRIGRRIRGRAAASGGGEGGTGQGEARRAPHRHGRAPDGQKGARNGLASVVGAVP